MGCIMCSTCLLDLFFVDRGEQVSLYSLIKEFLDVLAEEGE